MDFIGKSGEYIGIYIIIIVFLFVFGYGFKNNMIGGKRRYKY
jgi:hypothetical protein